MQLDVQSRAQELAVYKFPSTPEDPSSALFEGLKELLSHKNAGSDQVTALMHGTTVATNAVLQDQLPDIGLITTSGFRDVLELGRQRRPHLYNLDVGKPRPPAPRRLRLEVNERIDAQGEVTVRVQADGSDDEAPSTFGGHGADPDIVVASAKAYMNALNRVLALQESAGKAGNTAAAVGIAARGNESEQPA